MNYRSFCLGVVAVLAMTMNCYADLSGVLLPPNQGEQPKRLIVLLHGYGSNAQDLLPLADWVQPDSAVVTLQAPIDLGNGRYAWYHPSDPLMANDIRAAGKQVVTQMQELQRQLQISPAKTTIGGFSQGAVISWQIALTYPQAIGAVAIFSGQLPPVINVQQVTPLPRIFVGHGNNDHRIAVHKAEQAVRYARLQGYLVSSHFYPHMQHEITNNELNDFKHWLDNN